MAITGLRIGVAIPCYRVRDHILGVLASIGPVADAIYVVDDACPQESGDLVASDCRDPRVKVLRNERNLGVGGATMRGYEAAIADGMDIVVKLDGDGQMDAAMIPTLVRPIIEGQADYTKGNRFFALEDLSGMPALRRTGNAILSLVSKVATGYWDVMDPTNGFTAIHASVARALPFAKIANDYFFESDVLFRLATLRAAVADVPMPARYGAEKSNLRIGRVAASFPGRYLVRALKRLFYNYFLRDFNAGTVQIVLGLPLLLFGAIFGAYHWRLSIETGEPATAGTIMLAALPILVGSQLLVSALNYDIAHVPRQALHPHLQKR